LRNAKLAFIGMLALSLAAWTGGSVSAARTALPAQATASGSAPPTTSAPESASPSQAGSDVETACPLPDADAAAAMVDTTAFKKEGPWTLGVAAGYLANSWISFTNQYVKYAASQEPNYTSLVPSDAGFDVNKQLANIEDLVTRKVSGIIYWPIDNGALLPALQKAEAAGIPTVNVGNGFSAENGITSNAQVSFYLDGRIAAQQLAESLGGQGKIVAVMPIAGTDSATLQTQALQCVLALYPGIELLDTQNGDWDTAKSKTIAEAWLQRFPEIDGVYSASGQMSVGVAEAFDEAGRLGEVKFSPADEYNGWLKFIAAHPDQSGGLATSSPSVGQTAVELMTKILNGEPVTKGVWVSGEYVPSDQVAGMVVADKPDDWWPNNLPAEFLPSN